MMEWESISVKDKSLIFNTDLVETLEFDNLIRQAITQWTLHIIEKKVEEHMQEKIIQKR